jgi:hypothetical protein
MTRRWRSVEVDHGVREQNVMSNEWFARPVLFVTDIDRSVDFYVKQLGFTSRSCIASLVFTISQA